MLTDRMHEVRVAPAGSPLIPDSVDADVSAMPILGVFRQVMDRATRNEGGHTLVLNQVAIGNKVAFSFGAGSHEFKALVLDRVDERGRPLTGRDRVRLVAHRAILRAHLSPVRGFVAQWVFQLHGRPEDDRVAHYYRPGPHTLSEAMRSWYEERPRSWGERVVDAGRPI